MEKENLKNVGKKFHFYIGQWILIGCSTYLNIRHQVIDSDSDSLQPAEPPELHVKDLVDAYGRWSLTRLEPEVVSSEKRFRHIYFVSEKSLHAVAKSRKRVSFVLVFSCTLMQRFDRSHAMLSLRIPRIPHYWFECFIDKAVNTEKNQVTPRIYFTVCHSKLLHN